MKKSYLLLVLLVTVLFGQRAAVAQFTNGQNANVVLGQVDFTSNATATTATGLNNPIGIAVDASTGKVFVTDGSNNRVLRFTSAAAAANGSAAEVVFGQPNFTSNSAAATQSGMNYPWGCTLDNAGNLYVADANNNRVLRFANAATAASGASAAAVLGQATFTSSASATTQSGMNYPSAMTVDGSGNLYVADALNHRVLRFASAATAANGANATAVLGQATFTTATATLTQSGLNNPSGVAVDGSGNLYVADQDNNRVLRFANASSAANGASATAVLGQATFTTSTGTTTQSGMKAPYNVAVDGSGNLYVSDPANNRVLQFTNAASLANGANATTVLGQANFTSNASATTQSGMQNPIGVATDASGNLFVVDFANNRVLRWNVSFANGQNATVVLGQTNFTSSTAATTASGMTNPIGIAVDASTGKVFVTDANNNRVLRFSSAATATSGSAAEAVFGQPNFTSGGTAATQSGMNYPWACLIDNAGNLYVADNRNNRVLRYANAATAANGASAAAVLGQANFTTSTATTTQSGMNSPAALAMDGSGNLYVADALNHRVLRFASAATAANGATAAVVLGQANFTSSTAATTQSGMNNPNGVVMDGSGNLYVADYGNNRVLRFANAAAAANGANATAVLGQATFTTGNQATTQSTMSLPEGVAVDGLGNLYVSDSQNYRVLIFANAATAANGANATTVLGQANFTSNIRTTTQSGMQNPIGVATDASGNLFVVDNSSNRVLGFGNFNASIALLSGQNATVVLGQTNFTSNATATTATGLNNPIGIGVDASTGKVFVADATNNRVLRFSSAAAATNGSAAEAVFGQPNFTSNSAPNPPTASSLYYPWACIVDNAGNLYVADANNNRVLRFANAATAASGASAAAVLGQANFTSNAIALTQSGMQNPQALAVDASGNLYVADALYHRVLRFANAATAVNGASASAVLGQANFTSNAIGTTAAGMNNPNGVAIDGSGNLYVTDFNNNRVLRFANASTATNGANATSVLGQANFTSSGGATTQSGMSLPEGVAVDGSGNLYVSDANNHRVLRFAGAASLANGANASTVLGQANFTSNAIALTQSGMYGPIGVAVDGSGNLFVVDNLYNRVLRFGNVITLPVELTSFVAKPAANGVLLSWSTATEKNNAGFDVERSTDNTAFSNIGYVKGYGTTTQSHSYSFTDNTASGKVFYRLKQTDYDGKFEYSKTVEVQAATPKAFVLSQNYPNPFNPSTVISYQLPASSSVTLKVYDVLGREVATLVNERKVAGSYTVSFDASRFASGMYFYKLQAGNFVQTKKMLLVK